MKISTTKAVGNDALKILIYGESGSGKTTLAGTINEPTLIISAEAGLLCLSDKQIDVIDISRDDDGRLIPKESRIDRLGEAYKYILSDEAKKKYKWIFIDSLTEISQCLMDKLSVEYPEKSQSLVMYGENAKRMRSLVKSFRDIAEYNIVMTALSQNEKDENNQRFIGISAVGSIADKLPAFFDGVFYLHVEQNKETGEERRMLITSKTDKLMVKDRSGKLNKVEPANLSVIAEKIKVKTEEPKKEAKQDPKVETTSKEKTK